ncbi:kinase-like protein [Macrolepiota fuliginosa MF-IS2]|uniref:Kinase-like protein n=1 Tax=Macrolepiota fuliginosa MF-IS2 TaxID=1400762 RepID=A0A9P5X9X8_9AGAR|nr:kinase-like protein [Macrolepiota fuliginosa MF-IS2]
MLNPWLTFSTRYVLRTYPALQSHSDASWFKVLSEKDILSTDEGNRILVMLSKLATSARVYPRRFILEDVRYDPRPKVRGGFASVHVGLYQKRSICAKVIPNEEDMNVSVVHFACVKEVILWAHLQHRNILPFYGVHQLSEDSDFCLVSPWMNNGTICEFAARENLSQQSRMPLISDVIDGLLYLHELNIVHSDLKGHNVLISDHRRALITDFGISHIATATARPGRTESLIGATVRWAPPEYLDNEKSKRPTKAWDVWSFGCLCYEVLSRRVPFHECRSDTQVIVALLKSELPSRPELGCDIWDQIDDPTWDLMKACWELKPEDRPTLWDIRSDFEKLGVQDDRPSVPASPWSDTTPSYPGGESLVEHNLERLEKILLEVSVYFLPPNDERNLIRGSKTFLVGIA